MFKRILIGIFAGLLVVSLMVAINKKSEAKSDSAQLSLNYGQQLNADKCDGKIGELPILDIDHKVVNDIDSGFHGYWAYDNYNKHIEVWPTLNSWDVTGTYVFDFEYLGGHYPHDAFLTQTGSSVTGNGGYPVGGPYLYAWTITGGTVSGNTITLTTDYTVGAVGTTTHMTGTIASDGTISGTWDDNYGGGTRIGTWTTTSGTVNTIPTKFCAIVRYEGKFDAESGQPSPQFGEPLNGDETGTMHGGYRATFSGKFTPGDEPTTGSLGTKDYACSISNPSSCDYWSWLSTYFTSLDGFADFDQPWWGWIYQSSHYGTWINSSDGSVGDIQ